MIYSEAQKELAIIGDNIVKNIQDAIRKSNKVNTGKMYSSINAKMYQGGLRINFGEYFNFVLEGRRAGKKRPPIKAILSWMNTPHGLSFYSKLKQKNKNTTMLGAAFVVANSIKKKNINGFSISPMKQKSLIKATLSIQKTQGFKDLEDAYRRDVEAELKKLNAFLK